ncbi:hypothetical protein SE17_29845, partial [Kouleothrix aurantiaca]
MLERATNDQRARQARARLAGALGAQLHAVELGARVSGEREQQIARARSRVEDAEARGGQGEQVAADALGVNGARRNKGAARKIRKG